MPWLQIRLEVEQTQVDALSDLLSEAGALSVTMQDAADQPLYEPPPGETPIWSHTQVIGLFEADTKQDDLLDQLRVQWGKELPPLKFEDIPDQDWVRNSIADFKPMQFGKKLWICPSWHQPPQADAVNILLDPGLAFGTGTHPTTALCLQWLDDKADWLAQKTVIDYGCGSGILGVAALKLGAKVVWGVDNDPQALVSTRDNAEKNTVSTNFHTCLPEQLPADVSGQADLILANILANPLCELAPHLLSLCKPGGFLVLSGILDTQIDSIQQAYGSQLQRINIAQQEEWMRVSGTKPSA
ncbi:50S ribosomal protein L11 methyltransferase [Candidatus Venteria ishoeyi]|nr:50S ribosomal protein L11 methyltransferase [Candidatus Venteria ishoeyi]